MGIFDIIKNAVNTVVDPLLFGDAIVYRKARVPNGRGGFTYAATQHACRALVIEYTDFQRNTDGIPASHRQLLISIDSLAIAFKTDDVIGFPDGSFWRPVADVGEPSFSILTVQVSTTPAPVIGASGFGSFSLGNFTFSGSAVAANLGAAEIGLDEFIFLGSGEIEGEEPVETLEGEGEFTYDFAFEGTAVTAQPASADIVIDEFAVEGTGALSAGGYGSFTYEFTFAGEAYTNLGAADIAIDEFTVEGSGYGSLTAEADIVIDEFTFLAEGYQIAQGSADLTYDFTFLGSGYGSDIGSGTIVIDEFTVAAAGNPTAVATAAITIDEFTFAGTGSLAATAQASITIPEFTVASVGSLQATAQASITIDEFTVSASGTISSGSSAVPVIQSAAWGESGGATSVTINKPSGTVEGDMLISHVSDYNASSFASLPAGWTAGPVQSSSIFGTHRWAYKKAGSSEPSNYTFNSPNGGTQFIGGRILRITGANDSPFEASSNFNSNTSGTSRTNTGITTTVDNALLLMLTDGFEPIASVPAGWDDVDDTGDSYVHILESEKTTAGATGSVSVPMSPSEKWITFMVGIKPA